MRHTTPDPQALLSLPSVTTACHLFAVLRQPLLRSAAAPHPATASAPSPRHSPSHGLPGAESLDTPWTLAGVAVPGARHRPAGSSSSEIGRLGNGSRRTPPACGSATRSRAGIRSGACGGLADGATLRLASARTRPRPARHTVELVPPLRLTGWPPSKCSLPPGWCCPNPPAPSAVCTHPTVGPAAVAAQPSPQPDAAADRC
jgi:hypothetical protein